MHFEKPSALTLGSVSAAAVGIGTGLFARSLYGPYAVAAAPIAAYLVFFLYAYRRVRKRSEVAIADVNNYLQLLLLAVLGAALAFWLKNLPISRFLLCFGRFLAILGEFFRSRKLIMA